MNEKTKQYLAWGIMLLAVIIAGFLGVTYPIPTPPVALPPVAAPVMDVGAQAVEGRLVSINTTAITATGYLGSAVNWHRGSNPYSYADFYYSIDQGTTNTITLAIEVSPDGTNYIAFVPKGDPGLTDGSGTIVASNAADASAMVTAEIAFPYMKVKATVTNSETVTPTVKMYLR